MSETRTRDRSEKPLLSVVFVGRGRLRDVRKTIESLMSQTVASRMQLVFSADTRELLEEVGHFVKERGIFSSCRLLLHKNAELTHARIHAAEWAESDLLAFAEDHGYPDRLWAQEITAAFSSSDRISGAAPTMKNANPRSVVSRVQFILTHGVHEIPGGDERFEGCSSLPWHSAVYRRRPFLELAKDVELYLAESFLQRKLLDSMKGARFVRCMHTSLMHVNMTRFPSALRFAFHGGRIFGSVRADQSGWGVMQRSLRALLFPLVAVLKVLRSWSRLLDMSSPSDSAANLAVALPLALTHALGEAVGCLAGLGDSHIRYAEFEVNRSPHIDPRDRHLLFSDARLEQESPDR
jgi:hypothetical protein